MPMRCCLECRLRCPQQLVHGMHPTIRFIPSLQTTVHPGPAEGSQPKHSISTLKRHTPGCRQRPVPIQLITVEIGMHGL